MAPKPWIFFIAFGKEHLFRPGVQIFLFLVCFLFTRFCSAQNNIPNDPENRPSFQDTAKVDWLNERGSQLIWLNSKDSALFYANRALTEANKIYYIHGIAMAFLRKAQIEKHFDDDFALSDQLGKESLKYFEKTSDKKGIATLYSVLWYANFSQSKFDEATDYSEKAYAEALKINDQNEIFNSLTNMFSIYRQTGNYEKAFEYAEQLYDIGIKSENKFWISNSLWNLAELYTLIEDYPVALNYYRRVWDSNDPAVTKERMQNDDEFRLDMEYSELFSLTSQF
ncbi:MAG: tetratricopeptide repeat protein, partial [Bacteroidota bacterium]|nr:tetratricopeptide repeat protein [Bacteroidota bacterium]